MWRSNQTRIRVLDPRIEIDHPRFEPLHPRAQLVDRLTEFIELLAGAITINLEIPNSFFKRAQPIV